MEEGIYKRQAVQQTKIIIKVLWFKPWIVQTNLDYKARLFVFVWIVV